MKTDLHTAARKYLGVPFRHRGRSPRALDCVGLVWIAYRDCGVILKDRKVYGREPFRDGLQEELTAQLGEPLPRGAEWLPGDVALIQFAGLPHHVGIFGDYFHGGLSLIHSYGDAGRVVEHRLDDKWHDKVIDVYRRGVD